MKRLLLITSIILFCVNTFVCHAQVTGIEEFKPDPAKVQMYLPYLAARHGGPEGLEAWKKENQLQYHNELWYYTESFFVRRNHFTVGEKLDAASIDISRFEQQRKPDQEVIISIDGYRDALVLLPANELLFIPDYARQK